MTCEDFKNKLKKRNSFNKYRNYFISIGAVGIGLFFLYQLSFTDWYEIKKVTTKNIMPIWGIYGMSGLFILIGFYGFWRIPKTYELTCIRSVLPVDQKAQIISQILNDFKLKELERQGQYGHFEYVGRFRNKFDIYIFYDQCNFYFNAQQRDAGNDGGFIDFGTSKRVTHKIESKLVSYL